MFAKALQALADSDHSPMPGTLRINHRYGQIDTSPCFPLQQMMQKLIAFKSNRNVKARLKTQRTQDSEKSPICALKTSYAGASAGLKDTMY